MVVEIGGGVVGIDLVMMYYIYMRIPQDLPDPMPTPSFTSAPISDGNKPGDFSPLVWIVFGLVGAIVLLVVFK